MDIAQSVPFCSPRISERFQEAARTFLEEAHDSKAANATLHLLLKSESDKHYASGSRNECVRRLAEDVEAMIGCSANLMFRTPGALHGALQNLMDAYCDAMDGIYYMNPEQATSTDVQAEAPVLSA
jgi:hypothetical protein